MHFCGKSKSVAIYALYPESFCVKNLAKKFTTMGRKGPRAKTKTGLKPVSKMKQLAGMPIVKL